MLMHKSLLPGSMLCWIVLLSLVIFSLGGLVLAEESTPSFSIEEVFGASGRQIAVKINYANIQNFVGAEMTLLYDPDVLEPVDVVPGVPLFEDQGDPHDPVFEFNLEVPGSIEIAWGHPGWDWFGPEFPDASGTFCTVIFKMIADEDDTSTLEFSQLTVYSITGDGSQPDDEVIEVEGVLQDNGKVDVYKIVYGNIDENQEINILDARSVMRYSLGLENFTNSQFLSADVNLDGVVDIRDARLIMRYFLGLEPLLPVE